MLVVAALAAAGYIGVTFPSIGGKATAAYQTADQSNYEVSHGEGYQAGYDEQYPAGYDDGYASGMDDGNRKGYDEGYQDGFDEGQPQGYEDGEKKGYSEGYSSGREDGRDEGFAAGSVEGTSDGHADGLAGYVDLHDPTYAEAADFILRDKTNYRAYDISKYNCTDYSAAVVNHAEAEGIRAAYVIIDFLEFGVADHTLIAFNTTDAGTVYYEPQLDAIVHLEIGSKYYKSIETQPGYFIPYPGYDDTVSEITVIW